MRGWSQTLLMVAALSACASHPRHTTQAPPVVALNQTLTATNSPAAAAAPADADADADADAELLKRGYRAVKLRGEVHYCRKEMLTGSRFPTQVCLTPEQIKALQNQAKDDLRINPVGCGEVGFCKN